MYTPARSAVLLLALLFAVTICPESILAQSAHATFRAATWGMSPDEVQSTESGTHLGSRSDTPAGIDRVEAYFDTIQGKVGEAVYGFFESRLVYGAYRFKLKKRDRAFSQALGKHMRATYGESERVEVSDDGRTIQLHWATPRTKVIARFAPTSLDVHFWDASYWTQRASQSASASSDE